MSLNFKELWQYRELLYFLVWRNVKVRYKQTLLGFSWAVIGPLTHTIVFTVIFGQLAKLPTGGVPPALFYMTGLVIWKYFATSFGAVSESMVGSSNLLTKIYFPRLALPLSACLTGLVDWGISFVVLLALIIWLTGGLPAATSLLLPALLLLSMAAAMGFGLFAAALNVRFRDVRVLVPFVVQLGQFVSVILPLKNIPETIQMGNWTIPAVRYIYCLNPMAGVVEGFRWCLLHNAQGAEMLNPWPYIGVGTAVTTVALALGLFYFRRVEHIFADIV